MRPKVVFAILLAVLAATHPAAQAPTTDAFDDETLQVLAKALPPLRDRLSKAETTPDRSGSAPLPQPSMTEPFGIGEALYDAGRIDGAVVSLLALMRVAIVPDSAANATVPGGEGLTLSESEVRALIAMGKEDLEASDDIENLPHSFRDLHSAVASLLPAMSVEQLAQGYTLGFEKQPSGLIAGALMGQPIEPDTRLTRTQIWFLLMDGFAGAASGDGRWGTADRAIPDLPSPNPQWSPAEWREVLARLPLVAASTLVTVNAPAAVAQSTTANPAAVTVTMRINTAPPPLTSRVSGRVLIPSRPGSLTGQDVTWQVDDESVLKEVGTITSPLDEPVRVGADGTARFVVQPGVVAGGGAAGKGAAQPVRDWGTIRARFQTRGLVAGAYAIPAALSQLSLGTSTAQADVLAQWWSSDMLWMAVVNFHRGINFDIPGLGGATRDGYDGWLGYLSMRSSGAYVGSGVATSTVELVQVRGPFGSACGGTGPANLSFEQRLIAAATKTDPFDPPGSGFGPLKALSDFEWFDSQRNKMSMVNQPPDGGYYRLEFFPRTYPDPPGESVCLPFIPVEGDRRSSSPSPVFMPFNDAQWTLAGQGYGIGLRARGITSYYDNSSYDPLGGTPREAVKTAFKLTGKSRWTVIVARTRDELYGFLSKLQATAKPPAAKP